jgi:hypothetical protein
MALGEPFVQPPRAQRVVGRRRDPHRREAERTRPLDQPQLQFVEIRRIGHECGCSC